MYKGKKISVAMASFNGEKYILDQLESICKQSVMPDEIIISDDGSKDKTLNIVQEVINQYGSESLKIEIFHNEGPHGVCKNFENALIHCTGDYIFLSDQDDIWKEDKVRKVIDNFLEIPDALCIAHDADLIDFGGNPIEGKINNKINGDVLNEQAGQVVLLRKDEWLDFAVGKYLVNGMVMCISRKLLEYSLPFPNVQYHDQWLGVLAMKADGFYYLNESLAKYRLHGNNTIGNDVYRGTLSQRWKKRINRLMENSTSFSIQILPFGSSVRLELEKSNMKDIPAYFTAKRIEEIGMKLLECEKKGSISGAIGLIYLFKNDVRYRRSGFHQFLYELIYILFNSKRSRISVLKDAKLY